MAEIEETQTPKETVELENDAVLKEEETPYAIELDKHKPSAKYVTLKVYCNKKEDGYLTFYRLNRNSKIKKLLLSFCRRSSLQYRTTRFLINDKLFSQEKTPNQENEQIDAMVDGMGS